MTAGKFCQYVNDELLPSHVLPANISGTIYLRTVNRWLHHLGFISESHKKGSYVDGHEREEVVKSRREFLKVLSDLKASHNPPPPCSDKSVMQNLGKNLFSSIVMRAFSTRMRVRRGRGQSRILQ